MLHHIGFVVTTISLFIASLCQMQEELRKDAEHTRLVSFRHSVPVLEPATVNFITFPAFDHTCRPCPSTGDPLLETIILSSADLEYEERLRSEQHALRLKSKEALLRDRQEKEARKLAKQRSKRIVDAAVRNAIMKMKYETNALIVYVPSPYPRFPEPVETIGHVISIKAESCSHVDYLASVYSPLPDRMARHFESSVTYNNTTFGINLHTGAAFIADSCKPASSLPSVSTISRHSQTVARVDSRLTTVRMAIGAFGAILLFICTCFGIRRWRSKARVVPSLPSSPSLDDSSSPDKPSSSDKSSSPDKPSSPDNSSSLDNSSSAGNSPSPDNTSSPESPLHAGKLPLKPLQLSSRARPASTTARPSDTRTPSPDKTLSPERSLHARRMPLGSPALSSSARPASTTARRSATRTNRHKTSHPAQSLKAGAIASPIGSLDQPEKHSLSQLSRMAKGSGKAKATVPDGAVERPLSPWEYSPPSTPTQSENDASDFASFVNSPNLSPELSLLADYVK